MARVVSLREGAHGITTVGTDEGSLFRARSEYFQAFSDQQAVGLWPPFPGSSLPIVVLEQAAAAWQAEQYAVGLLARAEQHRAGLEAKLRRRKFEAPAISLALDRLLEHGLLDDRRYAASWIRARIRRKAEGPLSLQAGLAARGLGRAAIEAGLAESFGPAERQAALATAVDVLGRRYPEPATLETALRRLGYRRGEILEHLSD